ncbi:translation initiation factor IF-2-like [Psammomys obesus]|uniref:translation initiation factor IF-2-like n=1 Tax=Psammomys obesus TaxID=48139 RepID=UPI002452D196|nr:translation initiation factor IF-2-like [Psammomys obesus]
MHLNWLTSLTLKNLGLRKLATGSSGTHGSKPFGKNPRLLSPPPPSPPKNALPVLRGSGAGGALPCAPARVRAKLRRTGPRPPVCGSASRRLARTSHGSLRGVLSLGVKPNTSSGWQDAAQAEARTPDGHAAPGGPLSQPSLPAPRVATAVGTRPRRPFTCGRTAAPPSRGLNERQGRRGLCASAAAPTAPGPGRGSAMPASHGRGRRDPHPHSGSGGPGSPPARGEGAARAPPTRPRGDSAGAGSLRGRPASGGGTVGAESARSSCCALPTAAPPDATPPAALGTPPRRPRLCASALPTRPQPPATPPTGPRGASPAEQRAHPTPTPWAPAHARPAPPPAIRLNVARSRPGGSSDSFMSKFGVGTKESTYFA